MARSAWKSLFGCFSSHSAAAAAAAAASGKSSSKKSKSKKKTKVAAAAGSGSRPRRPSRSLHGRMSFSDLSLNGGMVSPEDLSLSLVGSNLHVFTIAELRAITRDFSMTNFIGEGGFGPVYKGYVDEKVKPGLRAQPVAVKLLDLEGNQGHNEWLTEVIFLGQLRHPNLVKLIGYCYEEQHRLIVYEFMTRGSLEKHLFKKYAASLQWPTRLKIAIGAAKGLAFLHEAENPVIYRDFKTSNILLDSDYKAKLSDFGLAKDGPEEDETHVSTRVMGTQGYAAPEYIMTGHLTAKSDVYGFGVVMLETLTGKRAIFREAEGGDPVSVVDYAQPSVVAEELAKVLDGRAPAPTPNEAEAVELVAYTAVHCVRLEGKDRPAMADIVANLETAFAFCEGSADGGRQGRAPEFRNSSSSLSMTSMELSGRIGD